mgnify:CR=1 FL=1
MGFGWIFVIEWDETKDFKPINRKIRLQNFLQKIFWRGQIFPSNQRSETYNTIECYVNQI